MHKATHRNHALVDVVADDTQICVYDATVATTIPVDVLPGLGTYQHDKRLLLQCPRRGGTMSERQFLQNMN
jgi:hypothetical protein